METLERKETLVPPRLVLHPHLATKDPLARMDPQEDLARTAPQATMADLAQLDPKDPLALLAQQASMAPLETRDHQAPMDPEDNQVSAPSTAPSMEESSSRMARAVKRHTDPTTPAKTTHIARLLHDISLPILALIFLCYRPS
jgi:hypothetical protein